MWNLRPLTILIVLFLLTFLLVFFYNLYRLEEHAYEAEKPEPYKQELQDLKN